MIPWITSRSFTLDLTPSWTKTDGEKDWSLGKVTIDLGNLHLELDRLIANLNEDQWEIKLITPIEKAITYHEQQKVVQGANRRSSETVIGGFGLGWGTQITAGYVIIAQRTEYLSEADYIERKKQAPVAKEQQSAVAVDANAASAAQMKHEISATQALLLQLRKNDAISTKKMGLLRGEKYVFEGVDYPTLAVAQGVKTKRIEELEAKIAMLVMQK